MKQTPTEITGKIFTGKVVSTAMQETIRVKVERQVTHPLYKKQVRKTKTFAVHNTDTSVQKGDTVKIISTRPMSKTKHFRLLEKLS